MRKHKLPTAGVFAQKAADYYQKCQSDPNSRFRSWDHCYAAFDDAFKNPYNADYDLLSTHLTSYLASWGMYRGSSFLLRRDYLVHKDAIKTIILKREYAPLHGISSQALLNDNNLDTICSAYQELESHYKSIRNIVTQNDGDAKMSPTLITKILLGTFGCTPAYDRFFTDAICNCGIPRLWTPNSFKKSLRTLAKYYDDNFVTFESMRQSLHINPPQRIIYPIMKFIDMGFWMIGSNQ